MTHEERVATVARRGFTERQAHFLVAVMLHSGVFLRRQYCLAAGIARGQRAQEFLDEVVRRRYGSSYRAAHRGALVYHLHAKTLYRAIGDPDNRHRRQVTLARAIERLMLLDAVLEDASTNWLGTEQEKVEHFTRARAVQAAVLPRGTFGGTDTPAIRYFPDKLPIGVSRHGIVVVFAYLVTQEHPADFRRFLHRHADLLRALRAWEIRLVVPPHMTPYAPRFEGAAREELTQPIQAETASDLRWFFEQKRLAASGRPSEDPARYEALTRSFAAQRYRALQRSWEADGSASIYGATSPVLGDMVAIGEGRVTRHVMKHSYLHLLELVGTA